MMYPQEKMLRSLVYFAAQIIPSGVSVIDGESYGIRLEDPTALPPAVAVSIDVVREAGLELGSIGTHYPAVFTISGKSRQQRDALKDIVRSGLAFNPIPIYSDFSEFQPASGAVIEKYAALGDYFQARDMPSFDSDRERFFWNAVVFVTLDVLGL